MKRHLKRYFQSKGITLTKKGDCWQLTSSSGKSKLANIRWKTRPVWGRMRNRFEWSIPKRAYDRYADIKVDFLMVWERSTGSLYIARLQDIAQYAGIYNSDDLDEGGTVFLPVSEYKRIATIPE